MRSTGKFLAFTAIVGLVVIEIQSSRLQAAEVLINGNLETGVSPPGWSLSTSVTGIPGSTIPAAVEHNDGSNQPMVMPGQLGILVKPYEGNRHDYDGQNKMINFNLEQTATVGVSGRIYTFTGWAYFGGDATPTNGYSGGVANLDSTSPSGNIPSPTTSQFEVAFLNASSAVIGSPIVLDLRTVMVNDASWHQQSIVTPASPAGTNKVRVRVALNNMVDNTGFQDVLLDNFSLKDNVVTSLERLTNGNLNTPGDPIGWTQVEGPDVPGKGTPDSVNFATASINPNSVHSPGAQAVWLKPFVNTTQFDPDIPTDDGALQQVVAATAGANYAFSAWTAWEQNYCGGLNNSGTTTFLKMEFLTSPTGTLIGSPVTYDLFAHGMTNDTDSEIAQADWRQFSMNATAPAGTGAVRVSVGATGMFNSGFNPQSAFFDDMSLIETLPGGVAGDYNNNGVVDTADYALWRDLLNTNTTLPNDTTPGTVTEADYNVWRANFGKTPASASGLTAVPEPACCGLLLIALVSGVVAHRRWI